ncbi:hypothetical protein TNCV_3952721 [Trichonephila clavipes]|uniref:Uncharacterized protein n=1 Tax=Trichonephila clavipes TaxID=2585209 RepID=A0A8X6SAD6_TRICX|nr:hypothetical protein TNCV_3952721 [Trichonephila clavipes]
MPDRKFTPSGDKPFENGMNSLRFLRVCSMWWAKVNLRLKTTLVSSANIAKCDRSVCGISFTYRVNNRGELKLPCGRPLLDWSRRGERFIYSHSEGTIGEEAMNGLDQGGRKVKSYELD